MADTGSLHATRFEAAVKVIQSLPKNGECGGGVRRAPGAGRARRAAGGSGQRGRPGSGWRGAGSSALVLLPASGASARLGPSEPCRELLQGICRLPAISASLKSSSCFNTAVTVSSPLLKELTKWKRKKHSDVIFLIRFMIIT